MCVALINSRVLFVEPFATNQAIEHFISILGQKVLSLSVETTATTAEVAFLYDDLDNVRTFVAYVNRRGSSQKCSVSPKTSPLQCTLTGIKEATDFKVIAEVCLLEKPACEPEVVRKARTLLRGSCYACSFYSISHMLCLTMSVVF